MGRVRVGGSRAFAVVLAVAGGCGGPAHPANDEATSQASTESSGPGSTGAPVTATSTSAAASTSSGEPATSTGLDSSDGTTASTSTADATTGHTTGIEADVLELDPRTLVYFDLPIDSIRYAVGGHDPAQDACVSIIFSISGGIDPEALHCDDFVLDNGPGGFPYVLITPGASPPCEQWDYSPNVVATAAAGCVQIHPFDAPLHIDIDMTLEIESELFTGTITVDNQTP